MAIPQLFLCYAREDSAFCEVLVGALQSRGVDVLWDRALRPPMNYADQIRNMIRAADSCAMVLTPASAASPECTAEIQYAIQAGKRLIPILRDAAVEARDLPEALRALQWCLCTPATPLDAGVDQICDALRTNLDLVPMHTQLLNRIEDWEARGRGKGSLLGDPVLTEAEAWLVRASASEGLPQPTSLQREYVNLSRRDVTRRSRRFQASATATIVVLGVALALALWFKRESDRNAVEAERQQGIAKQNADKANEQNRRLLEEQGRQDLVSGQWDLAAARLVEAFQLQNDSPALQLMLGAAMTPLNGVTRVIPGGDSSIVLTQFSGDGHHLAVVSADGRVRIWNVETGSAEAALGPHEGRIDDFYLTRDALRALVVFRTWDLEFAEVTKRIYQQAARLWNVASEKSIEDWVFRDRYAEAQEPPSMVIATDEDSFTFRDNKERVFSFADGRSLEGQPRRPRPSLAVGPSTALAAGVDSNAVLLSDGTRRTTLLVTSPFRNASIAFWQDSTDLIALSEEGVYGRLPTRPDLHPDMPTGGKPLALSRNGRWAVSQRGGSSVLLDLDRLPKGLAEATVDEMRDLFSDARFSSNGHFLVTRTEIGAIALSTELTAFRFPSATATPGPVGGSSVQHERYRVIAVSSTGQDYLAGGALVTRFWKAGQKPSSYDVPAETYLVAAEFSADGRYVALGLSDGSVVIQGVPAQVKSDTRIDAHTTRARSHVLKVTHLAFDATSTRVASASADGTAKLWDVAAGALISTCQGHGGSVDTVAFSSDGALLATAGADGTARVWELPSCRELLRFSGHHGAVRSAIFDARGSRLATADAEHVRLWDLPRETRPASELAARLAEVSPVCSSQGRLGRWAIPTKGAARRCEVR